MVTTISYQDRLTRLLRPADGHTFCKLDATSQSLMRTATQQLQLSARAFHGVLETARTVADIAGSDAIAACFSGTNSVPPTPANVLGVLSLILWSLLIIISVKYPSYVMRADNRGEGGILARLALLAPWRKTPTHGRRVLLMLGVFGAALLYGLENE